jgi:hypothetical protein
MPENLQFDFEKKNGFVACIKTKYSDIYYTYYFIKNAGEGGRANKKDHKSLRHIFTVGFDFKFQNAVDNLSQLHDPP